MNHKALKNLDELISTKMIDGWEHMSDYQVHDAKKKKWQSLSHIAKGKLTKALKNFRAEADKIPDGVI